jgi:hypothetical protein
MHCAKQYDAESGATVVTRADLTMTITYADGSTLAQHAEGSRIYTDLLTEKDGALSAITSSQSSARTRVTARCASRLDASLAVVHLRARVGVCHQLADGGVD